MKKVLFIAVAAFVTAALFSYTIQSKAPAFLSQEEYMACYHQTKDQIQLDAANPNFAALHMAPLYYKLDNPSGSTVSFKTADGADAQGYFIKSKKKSKKWLFVIQEWWGLNDNIKKEAEAFAAELGNVNILALDMYDGKVANVPDSAMKLMQGAKSARLESIVKGGLAFAGTKAKIYTVGWCFGGGWSLQSTILAGKQAAGCVVYYGRPESNVERLKTIKCDVIGFFANQDKGIPPSVVDAFEENMKDAGKNLAIYRYNAGHGFANPSNPVYNKAATEDAHKKTIAFLKERM
jgi:carboxymethylenebutenolidase